MDNEMWGIGHRETVNQNGTISTISFQQPLSIMLSLHLVCYPIEYSISLHRLPKRWNTHLQRTYHHISCSPNRSSQSIRLGSHTGLLELTFMQVHRDSTLCVSSRVRDLTCYACIPGNRSTLLVDSGSNGTVVEMYFRICARQIEVEI